MQAENLNNPESKSEVLENSLTVECIDMLLGDFQSLLVETFGKKIFFAKVLAAEKLTMSFKDASFIEILDSLSWVFSTDYIEKEGVYYVGGSKDISLVRYNYGLPAQAIETAFPSKARYIDDKILISGNEKDVKKIDDALKSLVKRDFIKLHIRGIDISKRFFMELGIDIEESIKYSLTWSSLMKNQFNPISAGAIAIYASLKENETRGAYKSVIDTDIYCISGIESTLNIGLMVDRQLYTSSVEQGTKVTSGFSTQQTGIIIKIIAYQNEGEWFVKTSLEDSTFINDFSKAVTSTLNNIVLSDNNEVIFTHYVKQKVSDDQSKGVPFLSRIPLVGYLFAVKQETSEDRDIYFSIQKVN